LGQKHSPKSGKELAQNFKLKSWTTEYNRRVIKFASSFSNFDVLWNVLNRQFLSPHEF